MIAIRLISLALILVSLRVWAQSPEEWEKRGIADYNKGEYDRAIQDLNEAIRLKPRLCPGFLRPVAPRTPKKVMTTVPFRILPRRFA